MRHWWVLLLLMGVILVTLGRVVPEVSTNAHNVEAIHQLGEKFFSQQAKGGVASCLTEPSWFRVKPALWSIQDTYLDFVAQTANKQCRAAGELVTTAIWGRRPLTIYLLGACYQATGSSDWRELWTTPALAQLMLDKAQSCYGQQLDDRAAELLNVYAQSGVADPLLLTLWQGRIWQRLGRTAEALQAYRRAYTLAPDNYDVVFWYGTLLADQKHFAEARTLFHRANEIAPHSQTPWIWIGQTYQQEGRLDEAYASYAQACQCAWAYQNMAEVRRSQGRYAEALALYEEAILTEARPGLKLIAAQTALSANQPQRARHWLDELVQTEPQNLDYRLALAEACRLGQDIECARTQYQAVLSLDDSNSAAQAGLHELEK